MIGKGQLWKSVITDFFPEVISFLYPKQANQLELLQIKHLDEIMEAMLPQEELIENEVSRLAQIPTKEGTPIWFLIYVLTEKPAQDNLQARLFRQFYKILDQYNIAVEIMVLFVDSDPEFHPRRFHSKPFVNQTSLDYETYKLTKQSVRGLSSDQNPLAMFLLIALQAIEKQNILDDKLLPFKLKLFRKFLSNGYDTITIVKLTLFLHQYFPFEHNSTREIFDKTISILVENLEISVAELVLAEEKRINILN